MHALDEVAPLAGCLGVGLRLLGRRDRRRVGDLLRA